MADSWNPAASTNSWPRTALSPHWGAGNCSSEGEQDMRKALYILGQLNDADIQWLADHGRTRQLRDGEVVIREGQPIDAIFLNLEGALAVTAGDGVEVARLGAGEFVGEISFV